MRTSRRIGKYLAAFAAVALAGAAAAAEPVAMISDCAGEVSVRAGGDAKPCAILDYLEPGARVALGAGAKVSLVYFATGKEYVFAAGGEVEIAPDAPRTGSGAAKGRNLAIAKDTGLAPTRVAEASIVFRGFGSRKKIELVGPRGNVLDARPTFRWEPLEPGLQYRFTLVDETGRTVLESLVDGTEIRTPSGVSIRPESYYTWQVEARVTSGAAYSSSADFLLADEATRARVDRLRPGARASVSERAVFAAFLEREEFDDEARQVWESIAKDRPGDPTARKKSGG